MLGEHFAVSSQESTAIGTRDQIGQITVLIKALFIAASGAESTQGVQRVIVIASGFFACLGTDTDQTTQTVIPQNTPHFVLQQITVGVISKINSGRIKRIAR
ncbi:hypothetical protein ASD91_06110 [Pseudomonas sp. Root68]|nr:hypothetical protein ASD91_06110 [Pseudomonas sp. Root68]KRB66588.1 hypothetical protein ASD95_07370 [Pseudomonas sp. Root71]